MVSSSKTGQHDIWGQVLKIMKILLNKHIFKHIKECYAIIFAETNSFRVPPSRLTPTSATAYSGPPAAGSWARCCPDGLTSCTAAVSPMKSCTC